MTIRRVCEGDDYLKIADVYNQCWKVAYRGIVPDSYLDSLTAEDSRCAAEKRSLNSFVMLDGELYVGVSAYSPSREAGMDGWGELVSIYLRPEYCGRGLGGELFKASMDALAGMGFRKVYLWAFEGNVQARGFYERCGFVQNGDRNTITIDGVDIPEVRYVLIEAPRSAPGVQGI